MTIDAVTPRSRRAVLFGALGALAAAAAATLSRGDPVRASDGGNILLGTSPTPPLDGTGVNEATTSTKIYAASGDGFVSVTPVAGPDQTGSGIWGTPAAIVGQATATSGLSAGVRGETASVDFGASAVHGHATAASGYVIGVLGVSDATEGSGTAGYNFSTSGFTIGAEGDSGSPDGAGTWGWNYNHGTGATGLVGADYHDTDSVATDTGVLGVASDATGATIGVVGRTPSSTGTGVIGIIGTTNPSAVANTGVYGESAGGTGVRGATTSGVAGLFRTANPMNGVALRAVGRVRFDDSVGIATVPSGSNKVVVTPGIDITATSAVVATLQGSAGGTTTVLRVAVDATADKFTIFLTKPATVAAKVAWHVFG